MQSDADKRNKIFNLSAADQSTDGRKAQCVLCQRTAGNLAVPQKSKPPLRPSPYMAWVCFDSV